MKTRALIAFPVLFLLLSPQVKADISLFVQEALGVQGEASSAGHASVYFSNVCADGPFKIRMCQEGEAGMVIASYENFGGQNRYVWMAMPVMPYLYGVEEESNIPLYVNGEVRTLLRETYRKKYLSNVILNTPDGSMPKGSWREMVGTLFNRDIYAFTLKTSLEEDAEFVKRFSSSDSWWDFNALHKNCADFVSELINSYFPGATYRDWLNDFSMTTPKAMAQSLSRYAASHPERMFYMTKYPQMAGPIRRSLGNRNFTEKGLVSKKYAIPMAVFQPQMLALFGIAYTTTGWFSVHGEYKKSPGREFAVLNLTDSNPPLGQHFTRPKDLIARKKELRSQEVGNPEIWQRYKEKLQPLVNYAIARGCFADALEVKTFLKDLELQSEPYLDATGSVFLRVRAYGEEQHLGVTRKGIVSPESDPALAHKLMLSKVAQELYGFEQNRSPLATFEANWDLLMKLSSSCELQTDLPAHEARSRQRFLEKPEVLPTGQKFKLFFVQITN